jgi:hypothetical protein
MHGAGKAGRPPGIPRTKQATMRVAVEKMPLMLQSQEIRGVLNHMVLLLNQLLNWEQVMLAN